MTLLLSGRSDGAVGENSLVQYLLLLSLIDMDRNNLLLTDEFNRGTLEDLVFKPEECMQFVSITLLPRLM